MPKNAMFQRAEGTMRTKPSVFDHPQVLPRLAMAFCIGATMEEAAIFAGCSPSTIKKHIREGTPFRYTTRWGEDCLTTFDAMVNGWRCHITMLAKIAIYRSLLDPKSGTKDAWKILERMEPDEWGRVCRSCRRRGHGHSTDSVGGVPPLDLGAEAAKRVQKVVPL